MIEQPFSRTRNIVTHQSLEILGKIATPFGPMLNLVGNFVVNHSMPKPELIDGNDPKYRFRTGDNATLEPIINLGLTDKLIKEDLDTGRD